MDRDRPGRLRGRLPARPDRDGGAAWRASGGASSARSRWTRSRSSSTASCRSAPGDAARRRDHGRSACARGRHDRLRDRHRDPEPTAPRAPRGRRAAEGRLSPERATSVRERPGRSAWISAKTRYQRGTKSSRLPDSTALTIRFGDELGLDHRPAEEALLQHRSLREALGLDEAGQDGVHADAARRRAARRASARTRAGRASTLRTARPARRRPSPRPRRR